MKDLFRLIYIEYVFSDNAYQSIVKKKSLMIQAIDSFNVYMTHFICTIPRLQNKILDSLPEFQETKNFTLQGKDEDCQTSNKGNEDDKTTKDKVNNNIQTPEQETVSQGKQSYESENLNIESNSTLSPSQEDQTQGDHLFET